MWRSSLDQDRTHGCQGDDEVGRAEECYPALQYICDFPAVDAGGGSSLVAALLRPYPCDRVHAVVGSHYVRSLQVRDKGLPVMRTFEFPTSSKTGPRGLGRLMEMLDWLSLPFVGAYAYVLARRFRATCLLSVAHGNFFVAAAALARVRHVPFVLLLHDDWVEGAARGALLPRAVARRIYSFAVHSATAIFAVSPEMADSLEREFGVRAYVHLPAVEADVAETRESTISKDGRLDIGFAGTLDGATGGGLQDLVRLAERDSRVGAQPRIHLHMFGSVTSLDARRLGLDSAGVTIHGWLSAAKLRAGLAEMDILFLPYSFAPEDHDITGRSFPSKMALYLAVGKPILVYGPRESTAVRYARAWQCAQVVDEPLDSALARAIAHLWSSSAARQELVARGREAFRANHDVVLQRKQVVAALAGRSLPDTRKARGDTSTYLPHHT